MHTTNRMAFPPSSPAPAPRVKPAAVVAPAHGDGVDHFDRNLSTPTVRSLNSEFADIDFAQKSEEFIIDELMKTEQQNNSHLRATLAEIFTLYSEHDRDRHLIEDLREARRRQLLVMSDVVAIDFWKGKKTESDAVLDDLAVRKRRRLNPT